MVLRLLPFHYIKGGEGWGWWFGFPAAGGGGQPAVMTVGIEGQPVRAIEQGNQTEPASRGRERRRRGLVACGRSLWR